MPLLLLALIFFLVLSFAAVVMLSWAVRYRAGTARRRGRRWLATLNTWLTSLSVLLFLVFAGLVSVWIHDAFKIAFLGMIAGGLCGVLSLALTRWDFANGNIFYTPNRWLALLITLAIAARFLYGWWRTLHPMSVMSNQSWLLTAPAREVSLAVAGGLLSYYLVYHAGVRLRLARQAR